MTSAQAVVPARPKRRTVLVADDSDAMRSLLTTILRGHGVHVLEAREGYEAISLAREHAPALVIMDVLMPGMDGCQTVDALKADPATRDIPVIALMGLHLKEDLAEVRRHPFDGWFVKPTSTQAVARMLEKAVTGYLASDASWR